MRRGLITMAAVVSALVAVPAAGQARVQDQGLGSSGFVHQTNLVSNIPGLAATTDPNLVNAWGITSSSTSPFWIADNGTGKTTVYGA